ncbi:WAP four-disulfide core domain protein 5-like [Anolis sagrei]|uniref:WAP four-disulfide core domain protein 5-like n=1 Tax=Anolis sagrei TaxID=38937 RepID=UPI00351FB103
MWSRLILVSLLFLWAELSSAVNEGRHGQKRVKPGMCPLSAPPGDIDPCHAGCKTDRNCPGRKKCCTITCGNACLDPLPEKPGSCPVPPKDVVSPCIAKCSSDYSCSGRQKCCRWGCTLDCTNPVFG